MLDSLCESKNILMHRKPGQWPVYQ